MKGLLDFIQTPQGQGLLSALAGGLAGARRGTPFNNIGRAGLSGLQGYSNAQDQIRQDKDKTLDRQYKQAQMAALGQEGITAEIKNYNFARNLPKDQQAQFNQKPETAPNKVKEYQFARENGFQGSYMDYVTTVPEIVAGAMAPLRQAQIGQIGSQIESREREDDYNLPAPKSGPQPGLTDGGYVFNGGDPADPNNWRKLP